MKKFLQTFLNMARRAAATTVCLSAMANAQAGWLIDTGPGLDYWGGSQVYDARPDEPQFSRLAGQINISAATTLTEVQAWMITHDFGDQGKDWLQVSLYAANSNTEVGNKLYSQVVGLATSAPTGGLETPAWQGVSGLNWQVQAGTYWLVLEGAPGHSSSMVILPNLVGGGLNPHGLPTFLADNYYVGGGWQVGGGYDHPELGPYYNTGFGLRIAAVPEPAMAALWLAGLLALGLIRRPRPAH